VPRPSGICAAALSFINAIFGRLASIVEPLGGEEKPEKRREAA